MAEPETFTVGTHLASDGYCWKYRTYRSKGESKANVVCIHGIQSHAGWYDFSCRKLAEAGFNVYFLDRRGAGMNDEARGDAPGFRRLLDDIAEFLGMLRKECAPHKTFLVAISWGGKLGAALQKRHPGLVDGLALLCPGFCPKVRPPFWQRLAIIWSRLVSPARLFPIPLNNPELFTATPHWQEFLRIDPRMLREATARLLIESVRLDGYLKVVPKHVRVPVLILLAEKDRIIDNGRTRRYVERFASIDKEIIEYPGASHTLEFEANPEVFVMDLARWIQKHS